MLVEVASGQSYSSQLVFSAHPNQEPDSWSCTYYVKPSGVKTSLELSSLLFLTRFASLFIWFGWS